MRSPGRRSLWIPRSCGPTSTPPVRPAGSGGAPPNYKESGVEPADHALGHSRGGWTTKAHAAVDAHGRPLAIRLTPGQAGDNPQLLPLIDGIAVPGNGPNPRSRPGRLLADKAYSHPSTRTALRRRRIRVTIPERSDQSARRRAKGSQGGRPPAFDSEAYRARNVVERFFARIKQWRGIATRYDKYAANYRSGILLISTLLWLK
jgi:putative transposase